MKVLSFISLISAPAEIKKKWGRILAGGEKIVALKLK
jgi:hypothetical protein